MVPKVFANLSLDPVTLYRATRYLAGDGDAEPGVLQPILGNEQGSMPRRNLATLAEYRAEITTGQESPGWRKIHTPAPVTRRRGFRR
jgi:hypothetical protein